MIFGYVRTSSANACATFGYLTYSKCVYKTYICVQPN